MIARLIAETLTGWVDVEPRFDWDSTADAEGYRAAKKAGGK